MKKLLALLTASAMVMSLAACSGGSSTAASSEAASTAESTAGSTAESTADSTAAAEDISLVMWGAEEDQAMLQEMADAFVAEHAGEANITITLGVQSESTAKDTVLTDPTAAADVYAFADDQLDQLVAAGALQPISDIEGRLSVDAIKSANVEGSVNAATGSDGQLYAFPMTADNGYFMFYDKSVFTEDDVATMDGMMEVADAAGKTIGMDVANGWYLYSFFAGAGLELSLADDGVTNICNWNATDTDPTGVQVAQGILDMVAHDSFQALKDEAIVSGIKDGSVAAAVSGTWNAAVAQEAWGDNYAAAKLPTYTVNGQQVQMGSYAGYKLVGVNAHSANVGWAMLLADYITNEENQVKRFEERQLGPSNINAGASDAVQASPAIAALAAQAQYATVQRVGNNFWTPAETFGAIMGGGNADGVDLQTALDNLVEGIQAPVA